MTDPANFRDARSQCDPATHEKREPNQQNEREAQEKDRG